MISLFLFHSSLFQPPRLAAELPADPLSPWERDGVRVRSMSAKLERSAFHHSYFTLHSSTGCLGYGL